MNISRIGKYYYLRFLRLKGNPQALSLGAAIGVFIGITPTIPLHTVVILALTIVTRSSFFAGLLTSWLVCNPLTYIPQYYFSLKIGNLVTPYHLNWDKIKGVLDILLSDVSLAMRLESLLTLGYEAIIVMLVGGCLLALPFSVGSYYLSYFTILKYRRKKREKHVLR
jgi:uncharacterized protein (DUF2062 family)